MYEQINIYNIYEYILIYILRMKENKKIKQARKQKRKKLIYYNVLLFVLEQNNSRTGGGCLFVPVIFISLNIFRDHAKKIMQYKK